jgi:hypothetical protein
MMTPFNQALYEAVRRCFPDVSYTKRFDFLPMFRLERGVLSTSAPLEIARAYKLSTEVVSQALANELESLLGVRFESARGYLMCSQMSFGMFYPETVVEPEDANVADEIHEYSCIIPDARVPEYVRLRLIARLVLQGFMATSFGRRVRLSLHPYVSSITETPADCVKLFEEVVLSQHKDSAPMTARGNFLATGLFGETTKLIVTSHQYYQLLSPDNREEFNRARVAGVNCVIPHDGWLISRDRALSSLLDSKFLEQTLRDTAQAQKWTEFLFHLGGAVPSGDLDPNVALFDECASPLWSLRLLLERFNRFEEVSSLPPKMAVQIPEGRRIDTLEPGRVAGFLMPRYVAMTVNSYTLSDFVTMFEGFTDWGHRLINTPRVRLIKDAKRDLSAEEWYLVAGLQQGLSSILPLAA